MRPITGTHVYGLFDCPRKVALDLHGDRERRRDWRPEEELVLQRGRDHEAEFVKGLEGWQEPEYARRDWDAGAALTEGMLRDGLPGVLQGVLQDDGQLGIPDLLRREEGASAFGDWHYVVGDVKSSGRSRSNQLMQVAFYSQMLARLQQRAPEYGYLVLKDGHEERFELEPFMPALEEVVEQVEALRGEGLRGEREERPFLSSSCDRCMWSTVCLPELEEAADLSLVQGMTRGLRQTLEAVGCRTVAELAKLKVDRAAKRSHLEPARLRRLVAAAKARQAGEPKCDKPGRVAPLRPAAFVHLLADPFADRVLYVGARIPGDEPTLISRCPASRDEEWAALREVITAIPARHNLLHYGSALPRWVDELAHGRVGGAWLEDRMVDLARRLRGAAVWPGPVFGMAEHVQFGLGLDPHRAGRAGAAAMYGADPAGATWLEQKGASDLEDLEALAERFCPDPIVEVEAEA